MLGIHAPYPSGALRASTIAQDSAIARATALWVAYMDVRHETALLPFCDLKGVTEKIAVSPILADLSNFPSIWVQPNRTTLANIFFYLRLPVRERTQTGKSASNFFSVSLCLCASVVSFLLYGFG